MNNAAPAGIENHRLIIRKSERTLEHFVGEKRVKLYFIVLGSNPIGDKKIEGDGKTPEGEFYIFTKNPQSKYYLSLGVSYPSKEDAARGLGQGLISKDEHDAIDRAIDGRQMPLQKTRLGGEIYIHGGGTGRDWTEGCIGLAHTDIKEIFDVVPVGTSVTILP